MELQLAMNKLRAEQTATQAAAQFDLLAPLLFDDSARADYTNAAQQLALSRNAVAAAVYRLRKRYRQLIRGEIAQTVAQPSDIDAELRHLFAALSG